MYTLIASDHDEIWPPLLRDYGRRLLERAGLDVAERVLDLGCGVGKLLPDIAERAPDAIAVWGTGESFPAMMAWDEAFDRLGVPPDPVAGTPHGRELTDSPPKMAALLTGAGFVSVESVSSDWLLRWDLDTFLLGRQGMGTSSRRLFRLDPGRGARSSRRPPNRCPGSTRRPSCTGTRS